jgi:20S proteasome alpha/beta subunit
VDDNVQKIHKIDFQDGNSAVVCEAGNAEFAARAIELVKSAAGQTTFTDYRTVADCTSKAVSALKQEIREQFKGTAEELQKHLEAYSFELLIAHYWASKPLIFTLKFETGIAVKKDKEYCAIGCGYVLADFIISRLDLSQFGSADGMWTAVYAVEEIKKYDSRCGGRTKAAVITRTDNLTSKVDICEDGSAMNETIAEALDYSEVSKSQWQETARNRIQALINRRKTQ